MGQVAHHHVMFMHPIAGFDTTLGKADDLAKFADGAAIGNGCGGHLVPAHDLGARHHTLQSDLTLFHNAR
jgi:hypothetical protein